MDIKIKGNPGTGNTFQEIHIGTVQNYNPNATTVINNYGMSGEKSWEKKPQKGAKDGATDDSELSSPNNRQFERMKESGANIKVKNYGPYRHEIQNEPVKEEYFADLISFFDEVPLA